MTNEPQRTSAGEAIYRFDYNNIFTRHQESLKCSCMSDELFSSRWLDWIFWGGYLSDLSINYVAMIKDMEKRLPQLYYIKLKISYLGFIAIGVTMAT